MSRLPHEPASETSERCATVTSVPPYRRSFVTTQPSLTAAGVADSITTTSAFNEARIASHSLKP